jgi:hypothetical protein
MNKKLLEEVSRQKELMNLNEAGILGDVKGGLLSQAFADFFKAFTDNQDDDDDNTSTKSSSSLTSTDFKQSVNKVIDTFEGGYYHPNMVKDGRLKSSYKMGNSGETMMGMDRKHGSGFAKTSAGKEFWGLIDRANASQTWKHNYMGGSLENELKRLVADMIKPEYDSLSSKYLSSEAREIVKKSPDLTFNFIYATWNGPGWFQTFAKKINDAVSKGITNPSELTKIAIDARIKSGNSVIAQTGKKMSDLMGIKNV